MWHDCFIGTLHICDFEVELLSRYPLTTGKPDNVMLTSLCQYDAKPLLPGWKIEMRPTFAMGAIPQSKSISLSFSKTLALLCGPTSNGTVVSFVALLLCPLATCTMTLDGPVFGSRAASAVLFLTRIVKNPESAHMDGPESAAGLLGL